MVRSKTPTGYKEAGPSSSRPPTKKSKRPRQSEPEPEVNYNSRIFTSKAAEDRYDILVQRSPIFERGLKVSPCRGSNPQHHRRILVEKILCHTRAQSKRHSHVRILRELTRSRG